MRIKMPSDFGQEEEKTPWQRKREEAQRREKEGPSIWAVSWDVGGLLYITMTKEAAYREAAKHIMMPGFRNFLLGTSETFDRSEGCECECHEDRCIHSIANIDSKGAPIDEGPCPRCCPAKGDCCKSVHDGKALLESLTQKYSQEDFKGIFYEWNTFWGDLYDDREVDEMAEDGENYLLNIEEHTVIV